MKETESVDVAVDVCGFSNAFAVVERVAAKGNER